MFGSSPGAWFDDRSSDAVALNRCPANMLLSLQITSAAYSLEGTLQPVVAKINDESSVAPGRRHIPSRNKIL
jgi:hypothetical protein